MKQPKVRQLLWQLLIGFIAGFTLTGLVRAFLGMLPDGPMKELTVIQQEKQFQALWISIAGGSVVATLAVISARRRVSRFWLWFVIAFGITSLIPVWPHKGEGLLPLASPYVNVRGFEIQLIWLLMVHLVITAGMAWLFYRIDRRHTISND